jgi:HSP20 family protein
MYQREQNAANGEHGNGRRHQFIRMMQRAAVNVFKTENSFEMLVFAPGRIKEHFHLDVKGAELTVSYTPPQDFPRPDWILREYSRGGFARTFTLDASVDVAAISAKYADGVLQVSMPVLAGKEAAKHEIVVN